MLNRVIDRDIYYSSTNEQKPLSARHISANQKDYHHNRLIRFEFNLGRSILESWVKKEDNERKSRESITKFLLILLVFQLLAVNCFMRELGQGVLEYSDGIMKAFITGTFVEITALVGVIFAYLYKERKVDSLQIALKAFENINEHNARYYAANCDNDFGLSKSLNNIDEETNEEFEDEIESENQ